MIADGDVLTVEWLSINEVVFGDAQPCDPECVAMYARLLTGAAGGHVSPPTVSPLPDRPDLYGLRDGKHRFLGHLIAGRDRVRCVVARPAVPHREASP